MLMRGDWTNVVLFCHVQVEANDAVTVASMTRPRPFPNEALSDLAVSAATKLQCFRVLIFSLFFRLLVQNSCILFTWHIWDVLHNDVPHS